MEDHIIDAKKADKLEDESRYRFVSKEELLRYVGEDDIIADIGSGTGFFTDDLAEEAKKVYGVDFQEEMHDFYKEKGVPDNVELVHAKASETDLESLDRISSIFSLHEIDLDSSIEKFHDLLAQDGKIVIFDWSSNGSSEHGPPVGKRLDAEEASRRLSEYFRITESVERKDTFKVIAEKRELR